MASDDFSTLRDSARKIQKIAEKWKLLEGLRKEKVGTKPVEVKASKGGSQKVKNTEKSKWERIQDERDPSRFFIS